jgi:16S rRNA G966 N2-methylase RsmD
LLTERGVVVAETAAEEGLEVPGGMEIRIEKTYGATKLWFCQYTEKEP